LDKDEIFALEKFLVEDSDAVVGIEIQGPIGKLQRVFRA
jgi:hypothetical protein